MNTVAGFFKRIGLSPDTRVEYTYDFLCKLQYACVTNIAYENLDILEGTPLSLEPDDLYEKIVVNGKGGYCFEVNGLLSAMLSEMGFTVSDRFARYLRGEENVPMRRHRVAAVTLDNGVYICDIGIGQTAPRHPLKLEAGLMQEQFGETYRFDYADSLGWVLSDLHKGEWRAFFSFTDEINYPIDFVQPSFYCENHPDSPFNKTPMLSIKTADGRKTIDDRVYKIWVGDDVVHVEDNITDERFDEILKKEFLLSV